MDMPESTVRMPSSEATKRTAHEAQDMSGEASLIRRAASRGGFASLPPLTGSMTTMGLPCLRATS